MCVKFSLMSWIMLHSSLHWAVWLLNVWFCLLFVIFIDSGEKKSFSALKFTVNGETCLTGVCFSKCPVSSRSRDNSSKIKGKQIHLSSVCHRKGWIHSVCKLIISAFQIQLIMWKCTVNIEQNISVERPIEIRKIKIEGKLGSY